MWQAVYQINKKTVFENKFIFNYYVITVQNKEKRKYFLPLSPSFE